MKCSVRGCASKYYNKEHVTFHRLPKNEILKQKWLESIGLENLDKIVKTIYVCSLHFESKCFNRTLGVTRLRDEVIPTLFTYKSLIQINDAVESQVCRLCLTTDCKMRHLLEENLYHLYKNVTGLSIISNGLPLKICWECTQRLVSAHNLRCKAIRSNNILVELLQSNNKITYEDIKSIDRVKFKLKSNLTFDYSQEHLIMPNNEMINANDNDYEVNDNDDEANEKSFDDSEFKENNINESLDDNDNKAIYIEIDNSLDDKAIYLLDNNDSDFNDNDFNDIRDMSDHNEDGKGFDDFVSDDDKNLSECKVNVQSKTTDEIFDGKIDKDIEISCETSINRENSYDELFAITRMTLEEQIDEINERQETKLYKNSNFKCTECFRGFQVEDTYNTHMIRHSVQSGAFPCVVCKKRFKTDVAFRKHIRTNHTLKYSCRKCSFYTKNRSVSMNHARWHAGTTYQCPHCHNKFSQYTTFLSHLRVKHASDCVCELCGLTFVSQKGIDMHKKFKHRLYDEVKMPLEGPYCEVCDVKFLSEEAYQRHIKLSTRHPNENDPNFRNDSPSVNGIRNSPRRYRSRRTNGKGLLVSKQSKPPVNVNRRRHSGAPPYTCEVCGKSFAMRHRLMYHMITHSAVRPTHECELCNKRFSTKQNLKRHKLTHTGVRPHKCELCGKLFSQRGSLRTHVECVHHKKRTRAQSAVLHEKVDQASDAMTGASEMADK